jgi:hypothetical protein
MADQNGRVFVLADIVRHQQQMSADPDGKLLLLADNSGPPPPRQRSKEAGRHHMHATDSGPMGDVVDLSKEFSFGTTMPLKLPDPSDLPTLQTLHVDGAAPTAAVCGGAPDNSEAAAPVVAGARVMAWGPEQEQATGGIQMPVPGLIPGHASLLRGTAAGGANNGIGESAAQVVMAPFPMPGMPAQQAMAPFALPGVVADGASLETVCQPPHYAAGFPPDDSLYSSDPYAHDPRSMKLEELPSEPSARRSGCSFKLLAAISCIAIVFAGATMCGVLIFQLRS